MFSFSSVALSAEYFLEFMGENIKGVSITWTDFKCELIISV